MRLVAVEWFVGAAKIVLVEDNLSTHTDASFYKKSAAPVAQRFERHRTPKHGSWLNMAECGLSVFSRQCLSRRIGEVDTLRRESEAWAKERNEAVATADWQFTTAGARVKLKNLYPII